jgi:deazaflavin-dependent oxidoreductase (nitroreductase family)
MLGQVLGLAGALLVLVAALAILVVLGWRARSPLVLRPVIGFSRAFINPRQLRTAGSLGASTSVVRHRGRKSGRAYETPVDVVPVEGAFLIALPYGSRANWLRNVLAGGSATILHQGVAHAVDRPELLPMPEVAGHFPHADQRGFRLLGIDECLRVRIVGAEPANRAGAGGPEPAARPQAAARA